MSKNLRGRLAFRASFKSNDIRPKGAIMFVAENFEKSTLEPLIDRERGWAMTVVRVSQSPDQIMVLYNLEDIDEICERDDKGRLVAYPERPDLDLSAITISTNLKTEWPIEAKGDDDIERVLEVLMYGSPRGRAESPLVLGCDWEDSKKIYIEALIALHEARQRLFPATKKVTLAFD